MSLQKKKIPEKQDESTKKPDIVQRKRFKLIYTGIIILLFVIGMTLILVFAINPDHEYYSIGFPTGLGIMGLAIILFTSRTTFKHSAPKSDTEKKEGEKSDTLKMRRR